MALKADRSVVGNGTDISYICNDVVDRGSVVCFGVGGGSGASSTLPSASGAAMENFQAAVSLAANPSGLKVAGLLLNNQVSYDLTRQHMNWQKDEMIIGSKCSLLRKGWVVTDKVTGSPSAGSTAYLTANGVVTPTISSTGGLVATPKVGEFMGAKDEAGYVKLAVELPA